MAEFGVLDETMKETRVTSFGLKSTLGCGSFSNGMPAMLSRRFPSTLSLIAAIVASTACTSKSDIRRIENGHYRIAVHASDSLKAEVRALEKSNAYCEKLKLNAAFDNFRENETPTQDPSGATVSMTFQCKTVPDPCSDANVFCNPEPVLPHK
jgi:hypothetical protein